MEFRSAERIDIEHMTKLKVDSDADPVSINPSPWLVLYETDVLEKEQKIEALRSIVIKNNMIFAGDGRGLSKELERFPTV